MKIIIYSFLVTILLIASFPALCQDSKKSALISDIEEIYAAGDSPQKLRKIFDQHYSVYNQDMMLKTVIGKNSSALKNKFVLWKMVDNPFGGNILGIVTISKANKINLWRVWIYPIDRQNEEYQIREFKKVPFLNEVEKQEFLELLDKKYQKYWM